MLGQWRTESISNSWLPRDGAGLLELDGNVYLLGGWNTAWLAPYTCNEVWMRPKGSTKWQRLPDAPWERRHTSAWLVHDEKLWVVGGDFNSGHYQTDVWCGTPFQGGVRWQCVTSVAPWAVPGRVLHVGFSFDGKLVVLGGQTIDNLIPIAANKANRAAGPYYDDVWTWTDGTGWELNSSGHAWAPCGMIMGSAVKDGCMWLVGGGAYDTGGNPRIYKNSVWKSSSISTWELVTANAEFPPRQYHNVAVLNNKLVTFGGWNGANMSDLWSSETGQNWRQHKGVPVAARHAASMCKVDGELLVLGGPLNDTSVNIVN